MNIALLCLLVTGQVAAEESTAAQELAATAWARVYAPDTLARRGFIAKSYLTLQAETKDCDHGKCWFLSAMTWKGGGVDFTAWYGKFALLKADDKQLLYRFVMHYQFDASVQKNESKMSRWTRTDLKPAQVTDALLPMVGGGYLSKTPIMYVVKNATLDAKTQGVLPEPFDLSYFARKRDGPIVLAPASSFITVFLETPPPGFNPTLLTHPEGTGANRGKSLRRR